MDMCINVRAKQYKSYISNKIVKIINLIVLLHLVK